MDNILDGSKCKKCGKCCIVFGMFRCPFMNRNNLCIIYKFRPFFCRLSINNSQRVINKHRRLSCGMIRVKP